MATDSKRHHGSLYYLAILAIATNATLSPLESLPRLQKGYTPQEIELQIKGQRGAWSYITHPGRLATYELYRLYKKRENFYDDSLTQIIDETSTH